MNEQKATHQALQESCTPKDRSRRYWLACFGGVILPLLGACKDDPPGPPKPPYGRALDVTQANTVVEFDVRIEADKKNPLSRYDVVLEVFEKTPKEKGPLPELSNAHFKVSIGSLSPSAEVIVQREVKGNKEPDGVVGKSGFSRSDTEKTDLMSMSSHLIHEHTLGPGTYRIRCENLLPMAALEGRLVKVAIETKHYPK
jgi:hypothetical protein